MAFTSLSNTLITVGKAIKKEIFQTLKDNQDDLNTRLSSVEAGTNKVRFFNGTVLAASSFTTASGVLFHRVESGYDVTDAKVVIFDKGGISSGTLEFDIKKSSTLDFTSNVSIFTTRPSLDFSTASSYDESSNAVLDNTNKVLSEGDYLRFDITSIPSGLGKCFIYLIGEPS